MAQNYNTKARAEILDFLEKNRETTVCASDILEHLKLKGLAVNTTTVYRYLNKLTAEQKVIKLSDKEGQKAVYQLTKRTKTCDGHIHTQCIKCGKLIHLDCGFMEELKSHLLKDHGFNLKCDGSIIYGICSECEEE